MQQAFKGAIIHSELTWNRTW